MSSRFGGVGRPSNEEIERQRKDFREHVAAGVPVHEACKLARIKPERALEELTPIVQLLLAKAA
jgi:hypothetical protein